MNNKAKKTLRLLFPQWQGGFDESEFPGQIYPLGAKLLSWLAPQSDSPMVEVPVEPWQNTTPVKEGGIFYRQQILQQLHAARRIIDEHKPNRIISFGGDCLISQAPFSYLNEYYEGKLAIIWIDAHPDVTTPKDFDHAHAMVLGNLLGQGEPLLAKEVTRHVKAENVLLVGVDGMLPHERHTIQQLGIKVLPSSNITNSSQSIIEWIKHNQFEHVAIHLDLDVLDPKFFYSLLFCNPDVKNHIDAEMGKTKISDITRILLDISMSADVVGMSFSEYMPWDALNLQKMLNKLPFMH